MSLRIFEHSAKGVELQDISNCADLTLVGNSVPHSRSWEWGRKSEG